MVNQYSTATFNGAFSHPPRECYEIATKKLRICYEFDFGPGEVFGG